MWGINPFSIKGRKKIPDNYKQAADIQWWPELVNLDKEGTPDNKIHKKLD